MAGPGLQYGITAPITTAPPSTGDLIAKDELIAELKRHNQYESEAESKLRASVLNSLQKITEEFVRRVGQVEFGLTDKAARAMGGIITTYGGYPLGVYGPGSDIDVLVIAPEKFNRTHFFAHFPPLLEEMTPKGAITELSAVADAHVPIISFEYTGISIDLNFCAVKQPRIPPDFDVNDDNILRGMEDQDAKSINGTRVANKLKQLVPEMAVFRTALKCIKLWAKQRGLYANIVGFPGGIAWAIMVAFVCQLYPRAAASTIVLKFFFVMKSWPWPRPIMLNHIETGSLNLEVWGGANRKNFDLMPVITPAYPAMCSTYNITRSTQDVITSEIKRGFEITERVLTGRSKWRDLFVKHTFFTQDFKHYLAVIAASTTEAAQLSWKGLVLSRVRHFVKRLEIHESIELARPYTSGFERIHSCQTEAEVDLVKEGKIIKQVKNVPTATMDLTHAPDVATESEQAIPEHDKPAEDNKDTMVYTTTYYIGLELRKGATSLELSEQVKTFIEFCRNWAKYDKELSAIHVRHVKAVDLPDDIFGEGEVKRTSAKKSANGAQRQISSKKRIASEDVSNPSKRQSVASPQVQ